MGGMNCVMRTFSWFLTLGIPPTNYKAFFEHRRNPFLDFWELRNQIFLISKSTHTTNHRLVVFRCIKYWNKMILPCPKNIPVNLFLWDSSWEHFFYPIGYPFILKFLANQCSSKFFIFNNSIWIFKMHSSRIC